MRKMLFIAYRLSLIALLVALLPLPAASEQAPETIFVTKEYSFIPGEDGADPEIGHSLCGTRCNALSTDFLNILEPGGWRLVRTGQSRDLTVDLDNPFMKGRCVCTGSEYRVVKVPSATQRSQRKSSQTLLEAERGRQE